MTADDYIDNERHRRPARKLQGDPQPKAARRGHPARPKVTRIGVSKFDTLERKYAGLAAKYEQLAEQARGADLDDEMLGSERSEPIPSETAYRLLCDMARMIVKDLKEQNE